MRFGSYGTQFNEPKAEGGHFIQEHVRGAEYAEFYAAHLSNVQAGAAFSERVIQFLLATGNRAEI